MFQETMRMNLPNCIKKVEAPVPQKRETKEEPAPQTSSEPSENTAGPSSSECPSPKPRASVESPKDASTPAESTNSDRGSSSGTAVEEQKKQEEDRQPNSKKSIDDARVCKICYNEELGVVFLPCGHMVACVKCAPGMTTCAVCREPVTMTVRAFFS